MNFSQFKWIPQYWTIPTLTIFHSFTLDESIKCWTDIPRFLWWKKLHPLSGNTNCKPSPSLHSLSRREGLQVRGHSFCKQDGDIQHAGKMFPLKTERNLVSTVEFLVLINFITMGKIIVRISLNSKKNKGVYSVANFIFLTPGLPSFLPILWGF